MKLECPHCNLSLRAEREDAGKVVTCPGCKGRFQLPEPEEEEAVDSGGGAQAPRERGGWPEEDHANIRFDLSFAIAALCTMVFVLSLTPFIGHGFADIFLRRSWVNYVSMFLFIWGCVILLMKLKKTKRQSRAMLLNVLPDESGGEINTSTVGEYIDHIYKLPSRLRDSIMVNRIRKALELFEKRNNNSEVVASLDSQSEIDANRVAGSYTLLKVFLWAIPILGFIGTVQGLSIAVGALSTESTDPEVLKESISNLTGGLGVAFDTTLLGLVLSLILSFPMAAMQKREEEMLTYCDVFCNEKLLPRLNDSKRSRSNERLGEVEDLPGFAASLGRAHEEFLGQLGDATKLLGDVGKTLQVRLASHQAKVEDTFARAVDKLADGTTEAYIRPAKQLEAYLSSLSSGIESLNAALGKLEGEQIVVRKRFSFFGRGRHKNS